MIKNFKIFGYEINFSFKKLPAYTKLKGLDVSIEHALSNRKTVAQIVLKDILKDYIHKDTIKFHPSTPELVRKQILESI